jgi:hypothetical protein
MSFYLKICLNILKIKMRLTNQQKIDSFNVFNDNKFNEVKNKYFVVSNALEEI